MNYIISIILLLHATTAIGCALEKFNTLDPNTRLRLAASFLDLEGCNKALADKADIHTRSPHGNTVLHLIFTTQIDRVELGGDQRNFFFNTQKALFDLFCRGNTLPMNSLNHKGLTALHCACQVVTLPHIIDSLIEAGASINILDNDDLKPLDHALQLLTTVDEINRNNVLKMIRHLLGAGADIDSRFIQNLTSNDMRFLIKKLMVVRLSGDTAKQHCSSFFKKADDAQRANNGSQDCTAELRDKAHVIMEQRSTIAGLLHELVCYYRQQDNNERNSRYIIGCLAHILHTQTEQTTGRLIALWTQNPQEVDKLLRYRSKEDIVSLLNDYWRGIK